MIAATLAGIAGDRRHVDMAGRAGPEYILDGSRLFVRQPGPWTDREVYREVHCAMTLGDVETLARLERAHERREDGAGAPGEETAA